MAESSPEERHDVELIRDMLKKGFKLAAVWKLWQLTHNIESQEMQCCDTTRQLYAALNELEDHMLEFLMTSKLLKELVKELPYLAEMVELYKQGKRDH